MNEKNLSYFNIRTDLVEDIVLNEDGISIDKKSYDNDNITVSRIDINDDMSLKIKKKSGFYSTIYFKDVTDSTNLANVEKIFMKEFKNILKKEKITDDMSCLVVGLGNDKSTPDSLGVKVSEKVTVTKHIYDLFGSIEKGYRVLSSFSPGVMGTTGIETSDILKSLIINVKPSFVIVIDALSSDSIDRVCKTIQITNAGISPGSGIGNTRKEISKDILKIPVIAIGVPMVVDATTIVSDTIDYMMKHFSYNIKYHDDLKNKLIPFNMQNYLKDKDLVLKENEKQYFFGKIGTLTAREKRNLIFECLTPIGCNLMVTPKEVDFLIDKLSNLIASGIDKVVHHQNN